MGKTYVACSLARLLREKGINVGVMKPFATGAKNYTKKFKSQDTALLASAARVKDADSELNPVFLPVAASPYAASIILGRKINLSSSLQAFNKLKTKHEFIIVEGIGGIMVPLTTKHMLGDFAKLLDLPLLIVARPILGSINHILLTVTACKKYGLNVSGIVLNRMPCNPNIVEKMTPIIIHKLTHIPIAGIIPQQNDSRLEPGGKYLEKWFESSDLSLIRNLSNNLHKSKAVI